MIINQAYAGGGGIRLSLAVSVASGSVVTATLGSKSVSGTAVDGVCVLTLPEAGTWTVSATLGGKTTEAQTVTVPLGMALAYAPLGKKAVGSSVYLNVNGVKTEFLVVQQGKPSDIYDDSCAGTWLLMKNIYDYKPWSSNYNDYSASSIHSYLNGDFLSKFDSGVKSAIKQVKIPYRAGSGTDATVTSGANGLPAKIFLLSYGELANSGDDIYARAAKDGAPLTYFLTNSRRAVDSSGSASSWWTRSPYLGLNGLYSVGISGFAEGFADECANNGGVRPALVLPSNLDVTEDGTISA